jgi:hypothetical protein
MPKTQATSTPAPTAPAARPPCAPALPSESSTLEREWSYMTRSMAPDRKPAKDLSGTYRVIHGTLHLPVPEHERLLRDGTVSPHASKTRMAKVHPIVSPSGHVTGYIGDEVWLCHADAERCLRADVVEPLDTTPSRCGKVYSPSPVTFSAAYGDRR